MKRYIALALIVMLAAVALIGCGSSSADGRYVVKTIDGKSVEDSFKDMLAQSGNGITMEDLLELYGVESLDEFIVIELKTDGSAVFTVAGEDPDTGTWKQEGDQITVTIDDDPLTFTKSGSKLTVTMDDQEYVFEK